MRLLKSQHRCTVCPFNTAASIFSFYIASFIVTETICAFIQFTETTYYIPYACQLRTRAGRRTNEETYTHGFTESYTFRFLITKPVCLGIFRSQIPFRHRSCHCLLPHYSCPPRFLFSGGLGNPFFGESFFTQTFTCPYHITVFF